MAYRADIEIAVKGAQELKRLQDRIRNVSTTVDTFNSKIEEIGGGYIVRNINNLTSLLGQAAAEFNKVALGTADATAAARTYIAANDQLNAGLAERVALLKSVNEQARLAKLAEGSRRSGGPRIVETSNAYGGQIGPGPASPVALRSNLGNRVENALKAQNQAAIDASTNLRVKQSWNKFFRDAAALGTDLQVNAAAQKLNIKSSWNKFFRDAAAPIGSAPVKTGGGIGKGISGAVSNAAIGGAFPLLFGQSGAAAAGGALGGIAGSFLGPSGGFAGSLVGTILGEKLGQGNQVKQLGEDIGFSAEQTKLLSAAFQQAGREFDKFDASVQNIRGLSLAVDDQAKAIQLVSTLTQNYGGQIDKVTNAFTSSLESGKVSQATLNQLTSQGIPIQQALADKYKVSRSAILEMAKDGKISVQDLIDTLVDLGNRGPSEIIKNKSAFDALKDAVINLGSAIGTLATNIVTALTPVFNWIAQQLTNVFNLAVAGLNAINAQLAAGRAGALNRNITSAKTAGGLFGATSEGVDQVTRGLRQVTPQKNKTGIEQNLNALKQYSAILQDIGTRDKNQGERAQQLQGVILKLQGENEAALKAIPTAKTALESFKAPAQAPPTGGASKTASNKAAEDAKREAERVAEVVRAQQLSTLELQKQKDFRDKIFAAETAEDAMLVRRLQGEQQLAEWGIKTAKLLEKEKNTEAQLAIVKTQQAAKQLIIQATAQDMAKIEKDRLKVYTDTLTDLQYELDLKMATTEEARTQLRIAYEMAKLKGFKPEEIDAIKAKKQEIAAPKTDR